MTGDPEDETTAPVVDEDEDEDAETVDDDDTPPAGVTRDLFLVWRAPRVALRNPQRMTNEVWAWLARRRELSAWSANAKFDGPSSLQVGPGWCGCRFGRSATTLPDGRVIEVGGEHEDFYDPDFYIYNDVVVTDPAGSLEIYGYPHEVFPPTDFHSATAVDGRILIVGCLGYTWQRAPGHTPVFALDTTTLAISRATTTGDAPGWLHRHTAALEDGAIVVRGGQRLRERDGAQEFVENIDEWALDPASLVWTRRTDRRWSQWELARADGESNELFWIGTARWYAELKSDHDREQVAELERRIGFVPDFALHADRYAPPLAHTRIDSDAPDDWNMSRISVDGVTVRYREESDEVHVLFEGSLPAETEAAIVEDARAKLEALERRPYVARRVATD